MFTALGREPMIEYIDMPESISDSYQYFTQAETENLRQAGFNAAFVHLEQGVARYVNSYLDRRRALSVKAALRGGQKMFDFRKALKRIPEQQILCIGDVMLDDFVYGDVTRISPEAPTPVLKVKSQRYRVSAAPAMWRAISPRSARATFLSAWSAMTMPVACCASARQARRIVAPNSWSIQPGRPRAKCALSPNIIRAT